MLYYYTAVDEEGKVIEGETDAENVAEAVRYLSSKHLSPISLRAVKKEGRGVRPLFGGIKDVDKIFLTKYLALMLKVGTDLLSAINILIVDFEKPAMRNFLLEVRDNLAKGRPFYETFAQYPRIFSPVFVNLVRAAEESGNLQQTFENLSVSLAREADLRKKVKSALIYPLLLLALSLAIMVFLSVFALPRIAKVFIDGGIEPPTFSRIVFNIGLFIDAHLLQLAVGAVLTIIAAVWFFWFTEIGRRFAVQIFNKLPFIKKVRSELAIQRFAATLSSLLRAGLTINEAISITAETVGVREFQEALHRINEEGLKKGLTLGEAFRREPVFPRLVANLIAVSEKAGHLEEVMATLADFYAANIATTIRSLVAFLEPTLLSLMGIIVGTIALAIIVPIYQLTTRF
ncbi:type II secretion system F family protein [Candidatus Parcubacteria bacterium]|nr:MAG: type II secretion system F family protein [Candidatus Parcubacteria bacterium]